MKIEEFKDIKIAYMRRVGKYGLENKHLMETFKAYLKAKGLLKKETTILGIALDNPMYISEERQRYDVGIIISNKKRVNMIYLSVILLMVATLYLRLNILRKVYQIFGRTFRH